VGGFKRGEPVFGPITVRPSDEASLAETLGKHGIALGERYVVVNPNASDLLLERRWPQDRYVELIATLVRGGRQIVLVGAKSEKEYVTEITDKLDDKTRRGVVDTSGKLSLGELFALIKGAACVVTNDTGPMHFSIALDRPTVCLFGPVSPEHYGVRKSNVEMIYHPVYCSPCAHEIDFPPCAGNNVCMQMIQIGEVLAAVERRLQNLPALPRHRGLEVLYQEPTGAALGVIARASVHTEPAAPPSPASDRPAQAPNGESKRAARP
jgi:ADP-heptose:LPS heptosyltransferase